jgi:hypothetical protein
LILCSDGLSGLVRKEEFAQIAGQHTDLSALCSALIDLANARGGPDNITVVAARFEGEGLPEANGTEGMGHQAFQPVETTTVPDLRPIRADEHDSTSDPLTGSPEESASDYAPPMDRIRSLALILIILGVLFLLLTVWQ